MARYEDYININTVKTLAGNGDAGDSTTVATTVVLDQDKAKSVIEGFVGYGSDGWDYYKFEAPEDGRVTLTLSGLEDNAYLRFFDSDGAEYGGAKPENSADKTLNYAVEGGKFYYVAVDPYLDAATRYDLVIDATSAADLLPAPIPADYNDYVNLEMVPGGDASDADQGAYVNLDEYGLATITGTTGYGNDEIDRYTFAVTESGQMEISLTGLTGNLFSRLYSSSGHELTSTIANNEDDKTILYDVTEGDIYTVVVDPYYAAESPYTLIIDTPPDGGAVITPSDHSDYIDGLKVSSGDAGEKAASATLPFAEGSVLIHGSVGYASDSSDWYAFSVPEGDGQVSFNLSSLGENLDVTLYEDSSGHTEVPLDGLNATLTAGQTYYLALDMVEDTPANYEFTLTTSTIVLPDMVNGVQIPSGDAGDSKATATHVEPDDLGIVVIDGYAGASGDQDWYTFVAPSTGDIDINLSNSTSLYMKVLNDDGTQQLASTVVSHSQSLTLPLVADETYMVAVLPVFGQWEAVNYNLTVAAVEDDITPSTGDTVNGSALAVGNPNDAGDTTADAEQILLVGNTVSIEGVVGSADDQADYYHVAMPSGSGTVVLDFTNFNGILSVDVDGLLIDLPRDITSYDFNGDESFNLVVHSAQGELDYGFSLATTQDTTGIIHEDNQPIVLQGGQTTAVQGSFVSANDQSDSYHVTMPSDQGTVTLNFANFGADLFVDIDGQLTELPQNIHSYNFNGGESFDLVVQPGQSGLNYEFSLTVDQPGLDLVNGNAIAAGDAGDSFAAAATIGLGDGHVGVQGFAGFTTDEGDCYQFTATDSGQIAIILSGLDQDLDVQLYNGSGTALLQENTEIGTHDEQIDFSVDAGESYLVVVDPFLAAESAYHLEFIFNMA